VKATEAYFWFHRSKCQLSVTVMGNNCNSPHEYNINGYSTHITALFPEHVRTIHTQECTSPKEKPNEHLRKFTGNDGIYVHDYTRMLVTVVTNILHANSINDTKNGSITSGISERGVKQRGNTVCTRS
jgi:hypothetical protein